MFACDIIYLTESDATWYISVIENLFGGEILAWKIGEQCNTQLVVETVGMLMCSVAELTGCILHSDGGSTYVPCVYRELLASFGNIQSMW